MLHIHHVLDFRSSELLLDVHFRCWTTDLLPSQTRWFFLSFHCRKSHRFMFDLKIKLKSRWREDGDPPLPLCMCSRCTTEDLWTRLSPWGEFGAEPSCAVYTAGSYTASILSKPLKRSSGDQADDPWKGLNKQLLALRTPPPFFFFFIHLCEHLAEMMTRCRGTQGELLLCCVGCVFVVSYACIRQSLKEVLAVPVN